MIREERLDMIEQTAEQRDRPVDSLVLELVEALRDCRDRDGVETDNPKNPEPH